MVAELVEHAGRDPFVASGAQGGVGDLAFEDRFDADPRTAGNEADGDPPKTQAVRDAWPVTAQRMRPRRGRDQRFNHCPDRVDHSGLERAHDDECLHWSLWVVCTRDQTRDNPTTGGWHLSARPLNPVCSCWCRRWTTGAHRRGLSSVGV